MNRLRLTRRRLEANRESVLPPLARWCFFAMFVSQLLLVCLGLFQARLPFANAAWPDGLLLVLATAATLASLGRRLPAQNIAAVGFIVVILGGAVNCLNALTGLPFGPCTYAERLGTRLFGPLPWSLPLVWVVAILSSREMARLMLRPWRQTRSYGLWVLGCTVVLTLLLALAMEPFAGVVRHYWVWQPIRLPGDWYGAPWTSFLGWAVTTTVILTFTSPFLIQKKPGNPSTNFLCPILWTMLLGLFAAGDAVHGLSPALMVTLATVAAVVMSILASALLRSRAARHRQEQGRGLVPPADT